MKKSQMRKAPPGSTRARASIESAMWHREKINAAIAELNDLLAAAACEGLQVEINAWRLAGNSALRAVEASVMIDLENPRFNKEAETE